MQSAFSGIKRQGIAECHVSGKTHVVSLFCTEFVLFWRLSSLFVFFIYGLLIRNGIQLFIVVLVGVT